MHLKYVQTYFNIIIETAKDPWPEYLSCTRDMCQKQNNAPFKEILEFLPVDENESRSYDLKVRFIYFQLT